MAFYFHFSKLWTYFINGSAVMPLNISVPMRRYPWQKLMLDIQRIIKTLTQKNWRIPAEVCLKLCMLLNETLLNENSWKGKFPHFFKYSNPQFYITWNGCFRSVFWKLNYFHAYFKNWKSFDALILSGEASIWDCCC